MIKYIYIEIETLKCTQKYMRGNYVMLKKEQETINELLTLGLIRKMLAREAKEAS